MATLTITTPGAEDATIAANIGRAIGLRRSATGPEIKAEMVRYMKQLNRMGAALLAEEAAAVAYAEINPS